jgi:uncharacterized protein YabE (DUF348 family)
MLRRSLILLLVATSLAALAGAAWAALAPRHTVVADGVVFSARGHYTQVGEVLQAAGVTVSSADWISPGPAESADPATPIHVVRARRVTVVAGGQSRVHHTHQPQIGAFLAEAGIPVGRTDTVSADNRPVPFHALATTPLPDHLTISRRHTVTVITETGQIRHETESATVGEAVRELGIALVSADGVQPAPGTWITPDLVITVRRSHPYTIRADGRTLHTRSHVTSVPDLLAETGIGLVGRDYTRPSADLPLAPGATIEVVRVVDDYLFEDSAIPFETRWQASDQLEIDTTGVLVAGVPGLYRKRTRITYENGVEVSRVEDGEWVEREPVHRINAYGTGIVIRTVETADGPLEYWRKVRMRVTSYTAATSGKAPNDPWYGITASGVQAGYGVVAVDRSVVPFRTHVYVPGYGVGFAGDTGGGIIGRWIDLGYDEGAFRSWRGYVDVYYLAPVPEPERINYLIPTWLP